MILTESEKRYYHKNITDLYYFGRAEYANKGEKQKRIAELYRIFYQAIGGYDGATVCDKDIIPTKGNKNPKPVITLYELKKYGDAIDNVMGMVICKNFIPTSKAHEIAGDAFKRFNNLLLGGHENIGADLTSAYKSLE
mgnify:CR=1 FL=1